MSRLQLVKYIKHPGNKWHHVWAWRTSAYKLVYLGSWFRGSTCVHLVNIAIERCIIHMYLAFIWKKHWNKNVIRLYPLDYGWKMKDGDRPLTHCRGDRNFSISDIGRKRMTPISTTTTSRKKSIRRWRGSVCWWSSSSADRRQGTTDDDSKQKLFNCRCSTVSKSVYICKNTNKKASKKTNNNTETRRGSETTLHRPVRSID